MRYTLKTVVADRNTPWRALDALRAGHTYGGGRPAGLREPELPAGRWPGAAVEGAAMHGDGNEARAGYRFGQDMHNSERYRNRSWNEADSDLEVLWNAHGQAASWEESRAAVHLGWNSISPEIDDDSYRRGHWRTGYTRRAGDDGAGREAAAPAPDAVASPGADWKRRHPGELAPWERFTDAVRHGWARISLGMDSDEADFRTHHAGHYPGTDYNDLAPVYRYGRHVRERAAFHGRRWDEVEDELRVEWERGCREGKPWTWDEVKAALQQGWKHGSERH